MALIRTAALAVSLMPMGETSRLVRFLTPLGRLSGVLKGARRLKSPLRACDLFLEGELEAYRRDPTQLARVREFAVRRVFGALREDLAGFALGSYVMEVAERLSEEGSAEPRLYALLVAALAALDRLTVEAARADWAAARRHDVLRQFELLALDAVGLRPELDACVRCGAEIAGAAVLAVRAGGVVCGRCGGERAGEGAPGPRRRLGPGVLAAMRSALRMQDAALGRLALDRPARQQWGHATAALLAEHLDRPLRSLDLLASLGGEAGD